MFLLFYNQLSHCQVKINPIIAHSKHLLVAQEAECKDWIFKGLDIEV